MEVSDIYIIQFVMCTVQRIILWTMSIFTMYRLGTYPKRMHFYDNNNKSFC